MSATFVLAQISDTHVRADDAGKAASQLRRAMKQAAAYRADVILLTGDLVNAERADEYAVLAETIVDPPAPLYVLPGNHDDRSLLRAALPSHRYLPASGELSYAIESFPVRVVMLDQIVPGETHGDLPPERADWLDRTLAAAPDRPTIVALHHPPFASHDLLFDRIGLHDSDAFVRVIARHRQVERVICGHHHRVVVGQAAHAPVIVAPSTSWTYGLAAHADQPIAPITGEQPGWMLHLWRPGVGFASHFMGL